MPPSNAHTAATAATALGRSAAVLTFSARPERSERSAAPSATRQARLAALRQRIAAIERAPFAPLAPAALAAPAAVPPRVDSAPGPAAVLDFGLPVLDRALPAPGLSAIGLHDVLAATPAPADLAAASGFGAVLAARAARAAQATGRGGGVLWIARQIDLYAPGLPAFGLDPARLILLRARREEEALWAMEEALRAGCLACVVAEIRRLGLSAARRLQLAAERGRTMALLLRAQGAAAARGEGHGAVLSRWRIAPAGLGAEALAAADAPGIGDRLSRWRLELLRCRGGRPGRWLIEWNHETHTFDLAAPLAQRAPGLGIRRRRG